MIRALDARIIAVHQWVVNLTQRQPAWLARQGVMLGLLATAVSWATFGTSSPWAAALLALTYLVMLGATYVPGWFHAATPLDLPLRLLAALWLTIEASVLLIALAMSATPDIAARLALSIVSDLALSGFYYFSACHPPRPRVPRPRGRLAHGGAA